MDIPSVAGTGNKESLHVTKKEIVKNISEQLGLTQLKTKAIVQKTFDAIVETLVEENRIELRNFGVFEVKQRAPRKARNPRTGEKVFVPRKYVVTFKPGKEMEQQVRQMIDAKESMKPACADPTGAPATIRLHEPTLERAVDSEASPPEQSSRELARKNHLEREDLSVGQPEPVHVSAGYSEGSLPSDEVVNEER